MSWWALGHLAVLSFGVAAPVGSVDAVAQAMLRHMAQGVRDARPGSWISYRTDAGGGRVTFWRFSAVGAQKDSQGRDALWIEVEFGQHEDLRAPLLQMKMLVARERGLGPQGVTRLIVALGADPPQEISPEQQKAIWRSPPTRRALSELPSNDEIIRPGREVRLMTRAGTLPAIPIEIYHQGSLIERIWLSYRLPLLGLAKLEMPSIGHAMEVTGFGLDALSRMAVPGGVDPRIQLDRKASRGAP